MISDIQAFVDFAVGDVVWLKSGSPALSVVGFDLGSGLVDVAWMDGRKPKVEGFPAACLTREEPVFDCGMAKG